MLDQASGVTEEPLLRDVFAAVKNIKLGSVVGLNHSARLLTQLDGVVLDIELARSTFSHRSHLGEELRTADAGCVLDNHRGQINGLPWRCHGNRELALNHSTSDHACCNGLKDGIIRGSLT